MQRVMVSGVAFTLKINVVSVMEFFLLFGIDLFIRLMYHILCPVET